MGLTKRVERLERQSGAAIDAAYSRILTQLTDEELRALAGPEGLWDKLSDGELAAMARSGRVPAGLHLPAGLAGYEPPGEVLRRLWELATPRERRLLELPGGERPETAICAI